MHKFFIFIILSDYKMSMSSLSGSLDMFIISWCLIKRSLPIWKAKITIHYSAVKWLKRKTNNPSKVKTEKAKKSSVFKPCVFKLLMIKCKIYGTSSEIRYSVTLKNGVDFGGPFKRSSGLWPNAWKNASKD